MCCIGDVGSGKTIVALMAILQAVEANKQVVLLAPTGIRVGEGGGVEAVALLLSYFLYYCYRYCSCVESTLH